MSDMKERCGPKAWAEISDPSTICDRLRGLYRIPINDGLGPIDGKMTFDRQHETPPIQHAAAELIEELQMALLDATASLMAASSAYERHAGRARTVKPRAVADALFTTRLADFKNAAHRAAKAIQKLGTRNTQPSPS